MAKPRVFVSRAIPDKGLTLIREYCEADVWMDELPPSRDVILERIEGVEGILSLLTDKMDAAVMAAAGPGLKVISNYAVGFDNIDLPAANQRGIPIGHTPGILTDTTADFAFALLMAAARRVVAGDNYTRAGQWQTWSPKLLLGVDIHGATLGLVGFGRIGQAMARRALGFEMRVLYYDPANPNDPDAIALRAESADLDTVLRESDFVSIHTPLTEQTYHLFNDDRLATMKAGAALINTARGPVVDPDALYRALKKGSLACAALDVTEPEPIPFDSPLLDLDNIIITPHIASASQATRARMAEMAANNLLAGLRGEKLPHCVNPEVYFSFR
jgi:glyoxylate reductase